MKKISIFILLLLLQSCSAQKVYREIEPKKESALQTFENTPALKGAHVGISIVELETGKVIVAKNADQNLTPASNLKILYTLTVIEKFGKEFRYKTRLFQDGKIIHGILSGNLVFDPSGDPSFASLRLDEDYRIYIDSIISKLKQKKIKKIQGDIVMQLNGWRYPAPGSWPIEDIGNYYGTGAWEFNFRDNQADIYLKRSNQEGQHAKIINIIPDIPGFELISKVKTAATDTDDESYIFGAPYTNPRYILGTIPAGEKDFKIKAGIPNPPLSFLKIFRKKLNEAGISSKGIKIVHQQKKYDQLIWEHQSEPLLKLVKITNDYSMNHFSEAFAWLLIQGDKPSAGYLDKKAINHFFEAYGFSEADLEDGCGLAPDNLVRPEQMTGFLRLMTQKLGRKTVLDILPHGGEDGYAKYFLRKSSVQKQVWVKSGSVSKVRNYVGIFEGNSGKYYAFSVMTNMFTSTHREVRTAIEKLVEYYIFNL